MIVVTRDPKVVSNNCWLLAVNFWQKTATETGIAWLTPGSLGSKAVSNTVVTPFPRRPAVSCPTLAVSGLRRVLPCL